MDREKLRINCNIPEFANQGYFVEIPKRWLGEDSETFNQASELASELGLKGVYYRFSVSLALAENWNLPSLSGPAKNWNFGPYDLELMLWVIEAVLNSFEECFRVKKNYFNLIGTNLQKFQKMFLHGDSVKMEF